MRWLILMAMTACGPMSTVEKPRRVVTVAGSCSRCPVGECTRCGQDAGQEDGPWL